MNELVKKAKGASYFPFLNDRVSIIVSSNDTNGVYSMMHWIVGPRTVAYPHVHDLYEETFYLLKGELEFQLGDESISLSERDFVRVPAGVRHGFRNQKDEEVDLLVSLSPGGMEEFFRKYQCDVDGFDLDSYLVEAKDVHRTEYEVGS